MVLGLFELRSNWAWAELRGCVWSHRTFRCLFDSKSQVQLLSSIKLIRPRKTGRILRSDADNNLSSGCSN